MLIYVNDEDIAPASEGFGLDLKRRLSRMARTPVASFRCLAFSAPHTPKTLSPPDPQASGASCTFFSWLNLSDLHFRLFHSANENLASHQTRGQPQTQNPEGSGLMNFANELDDRIKTDWHAALAVGFDLGLPGVFNVEWVIDRADYGAWHGKW